MIELLIFNSLIIWGVFTSLHEGMIFERVGGLIRGDHYLDTDTRTIEFHLPEWIKKPLAICPICMASVYGTPIFWGAYIIDVINFDYIIIVYICYEFALAGLNYLILAFMSDE